MKKLMDKILDLILYGDVRETPLHILGDHYNDKQKYDDEQLLRLHIAATLKHLYKHLTNQKQAWYKE